MDFIADRTMRFIETLGGIKTFAELIAFMDETMASLSIPFHALYQNSNVDTANIDSTTQIIKTKSHQSSEAESLDVRGVHNFPIAWVQRYMDRGYHVVNPLIRKVVRTKSAFRWDTLEPEGYLNAKRSRLVLQEAAEFGLRDGFVCPIVHSSGDTVIVTFAGDRLDDDPRLAPSLHLIALYFHQRFTALQGLGDGSAVPDLTRQEESCLTLAGTGKTDWEISEILSISESSVRTYLERAKRKFGVRTKIQAVVEAKRHLLIHS